MDEYSQYSNGALLKNKYRRIADLNEGSYGLVTVAKDTTNNRLVAVKFIYPLNYKKDLDNARPSSSPAKLRNKISEQDANRQSTNEILRSLYEEAAKEISIHEILGVHANISALYDHFDSYLILEYCSRGDLYEAIQNGQGPTTSKDIKDVFYQILDALQYCHSKGVYHRDLKPENILIDDDWSLKLCDWGLATTCRKVYDKSEFDVGSERYMAPELFDNELEYYDASKIDIWSIGIILLTIVFHKNPFEVANYSDKRFLQFATSRESLFDVFSTMSGDLFSVLRYCLNIDPNNRDLLSVRKELDILNFFTIDEESWASDVSYESDEESDLNHYSELDDDTTVSGGNDTKPESLDGSKIEKLRAVSTRSHESSLDEGDSTFYMDEDADKSNSTLTKQSAKKGVSEDVDISRPKHLEKQEDILSNNTSLKPIPIGDSANNRNKYFRSNRKSIGVVSYNSYQNRHNIQSNKTKFNREDYFTPKSVFNHYMNKYGEKDKPNKYSMSQTHQGSGQYRNKPNYWKKNNNKPKTWKKNYRNNRQKQNFYSKRNNVHSQSHHTEPMSNNNGYNGIHTRHKSEFVQRKKADSFSMSRSKAKNIINPVTQSQMLSSSGKYIPPYMRSPNYQSPNIIAVEEALDNINLNDDGVFELDDDDDFTLDSQPTRYDHKKQQLQTNYNDILASDSHGKYVPPFRRASQSGHPPNDLKEPHKRKSKQFVDFSNLQNSPSSVPNSSTDWFAYKKDWGPYD